MRRTLLSSPTYYVSKNEKLIMNNPTAIVIGAVIIAAAILIVFRWQLAPPGELLDRWTGTILQCITVRSSEGKVSIALASANQPHSEITLECRCARNALVIEAAQRLIQWKRSRLREPKDRFLFSVLAYWFRSSERAAACADLLSLPLPTMF